MNRRKPSDSPHAWRRVSHYLAETGLARDVFLAAARRGELKYEIAQFGAARIWHARPRRPEPTLAARIYGERERWRAPVDETEPQSTFAARVYARARS